ncbi:MAG: peroxiredoxin-like family protein [Catenulispora sp.]
MSLNAELEAFYQARQQQIPPATREIMTRAAEALAASGVADRTLTAGDVAPSFTLPSATGQSIALAERLAEGPVVLSFYRGAWCPYCNITLRALQQAHADITARGAHLIAVSPQIPDESLSLAEKHQLGFDVLSDVGCVTATDYGLSFDIGDELAELYDRLGFDFERVNAGHTRTLPLPATFVIAPDRTIVWSFADADYTKRAEPADILAALDKLGVVSPSGA